MTLEVQQRRPIGIQRTLLLATLMAVITVAVAFGDSSAADEHDEESGSAPSITSVSPDRAPTVGGVEVTITGNDLDDAETVHFGDELRGEAEFTQDAPDQLTATVPHRHAGSMHVTVTTPEGTSEPTEESEFEFYAVDGTWEPTGDPNASGRNSALEILGGPACNGGDPPDYCGQILVVSSNLVDLYDPASGEFAHCDEGDESPACPGQLPDAPTAEWEGRTTTLDGPECRDGSPEDYCGKVLAAAEHYAALYDPDEAQWHACAEEDAHSGCPAQVTEEDNWPEWVEKLKLLDGPECRGPEDAPEHCGTVLGAQDQHGPSWIYDPATGLWEETGSMNHDNRHYNLTLIDGPYCEGDNPHDACGNVLAGPGFPQTEERTCDYGDRRINCTAELYDPETGEWRFVDDPIQGNRSFGFTTTLLPDGRAVMAGGMRYTMGTCRAADNAIVREVEAYSPVDDEWAIQASLPQARMFHDDVLLPDGRVLITGGEEELQPGRDCEDAPSTPIFDPEAGPQGEWTYSDTVSGFVTAPAATQAANRLSLTMIPEGPEEMCGDNCGKVLAVGRTWSEEAGSYEGQASLYGIAEDGALVGAVTESASGGRLGGVDVVLSAGDGAVVAEATTADGSGTYQMENVEPGEYTVTVDADGYETDSAEVEITAAELSTADLSPTALPGVVTGEVADSASSEPVEGAEVELSDDAGSATTDGDGAFEIDELDAGAYTVSIDADGYESTSEEVEIGPGETVDLEVALDPFGAIEGQAADADSGDAIEGADVTVTDGDAVVVGEVTAGSDGTFAVDDLAAGDYTVSVDADGYESASTDVDVEAGQTATVDVALDPVALDPVAVEPGVVAGEVVDADSGEAVAGAEVALSDGGGSATTDTDGAFELDDVEPGGYTVTADADGYESASQDVEVDAGETVTVDFALDPVEVVDPEMARMDGATRIHTAADVAERGYPGGADTVVVARADDYADALAGAPLAYALDAPVLLTFSDDLHDVTADAVADLGADTAILLGGTAALSNTVVADLDDAGLEVRRVAGATRFHTAAEVADNLGADDGRAIVAEGAHSDPNRGWPDPLSAGPLAAADQRPILLAVSDDVPGATRDALSDLDVTDTLVVGGTAAISEDVEAWLADAGHGPERISGATRYATSAEVHSHMVDAGLDPDRVWLATGRAFPDALAAGPTAAKLGESLLLVDTDDLNNSQPSLDRLTGRESLTRLVLLGGTAALSDHVESQLADLLGE